MASLGITDLVIAPALYQTWWFKSLYFALRLGLLWVLCLFRLKRATAQCRSGWAHAWKSGNESPELHDTLLQSFHGLMLRFQSVMKGLPAEGPARHMMEEVMDRADDVLLEGRESVRDLRESGASAGELSNVLLAAGGEFSKYTLIPFACVISGDSRALTPVVFNETYRIACEALSNAFQHSHASKIDLDLAYSHVGLTLRVRDDDL